MTKTLMPEKKKEGKKKVVDIHFFDMTEFELNHDISPRDTMF